MAISWPKGKVGTRFYRGSGQRVSYGTRGNATAAAVRNNLFVIISLLFVNKLGAPGNLLCYAVLMGMALRTPAGALKALSISGLLIVASDFFVTRGAPAGPLKYVLLLVAGFTILRSSRNPVGQPFLIFLLLFGVVAALLTLTNGYFVAVSLLKIGSFIFGAFCLLNVAQLRKNIAPEMLEWGYSLVVAVVLLSFMALAIGAGYGSYETIWGGRFSGYRGVFSHPQTLGVMACLFAVYLTSLLLFVDFPHRRVTAALLLALLSLLYLSEARTGMLGYLLAMGIVLILVGLVRKPAQEQKLLKRYQKQFLGASLIGMVLLIIVEGLTGTVSERVVAFLEKGKEMEHISAIVLLKTREEQIEGAWENFKENPWTGIGFGTDLSSHWQRTATLLSASTEKGFMPTALLEEVGIIGTTFFLIFIVSLFGFLVRTRRYLSLAMMTGLLVVNLGEMMFFAFGGMATLCWSLIGMSIAGSNAHIQQLRLKSH